MATIFDILLNQNLGSSSPSFRSSGVIDSTPTRRVDFLPELDVTETKDNIIIEMELAGVLKEDIQIEIQESRLVIQGDKKRYHYKPQSSSSIGTSDRRSDIPSDSNVGRSDSSLMEKHRTQEIESNVQPLQPRQPVEETPSSQHKDDIKSRSNVSQTSQLFEQPQPQQPISPSNVESSTPSDISRQRSTEQMEAEPSRVEQFNLPSSQLPSNQSCETELKSSRVEQVSHQPSSQISSDVSGEQAVKQEPPQIPPSMVSDKIEKFESQKLPESSENVQPSQNEPEINQDIQRDDEQRNISQSNIAEQQRSVSPIRQVDVEKRSVSPSRQQSQIQHHQPHEQEREKKYISERSFGHFKRYLDLTKILYRLNVNQISSHYENGLLFVIINKKPFEHCIKIPLD